MLHVNESARIDGFIYSTIFNARMPQIYVATTVSDFLKERDEIVPTGSSFFSPKKYYEGGALICFQSPVNFRMKGYIKGTSKMRGGPVAMGDIEDFLGSSSIVVMANAKYSLDRKERRALENDSILYSAQIFYHPADGIHLLVHFESGPEQLELNKEKKFAIPGLEAMLLPA